MQLAAEIQNQFGANETEATVLRAAQRQPAA
jgi:hypothetical protein